MKKILALLLCLIAQAAIAQNFTFFKDINQTPNDAFKSVSQSINYNGELYFFLTTQTYGCELWKTNGTVAGTKLVKDIIPGPDGGNIASLVTVFNNKLYFVYKTPDKGAELWQTDGTVAGTRLFFDFRPGPASGFYTNFQLVVANVPVPTMYISVVDSAYTTSIYKFSTSSTASRSPQKFYSYTNTTAPYSDDPLINSMQVLGSKLLFFQFEPGTYNGMEPWITDGTAQGTTLLKNIDTRTGTYTGSQTMPHSPTSFFLENTNGLALFMARDSANGNELWCTDGTTAGTALVKDIAPGATGSLYNFSNENAFKLPNNTILFGASALPYGYEPWVTDGTTAGTHLVKDIAPGPYSSNMNAYNAAIFNNIAIIVATDSALGQNPYITNGTDTGTYLLKDIFPLNGNSTGATFLKAKLSNGVFFTGKDSLKNVYLFITDGTLAGTNTLATYSPQTINGYVYVPNVQAIGVVNNKLLYKALLSNSSDIICKYYLTDGTVAGTLPIDFNPVIRENISSTPYGFTKYNGEWFFAANNGIDYTQLWKTDGTIGGTYMFKNLSRSGLSGASGVSDICPFSEINGSLYFASYNGKFIKYTGGPSANFFLAETSPAGSINSEVYKVGQQFFFGRDIPVKGYEPWRFNGTTSTMMEINVTNNCTPNNIQYCSSSPTVKLSKPGFVIFSAREDNGWTSLFRYSGGNYCGKIADYYQTSDFLSADTTTYFYYGPKTIYKSDLRWGPGGHASVTGVFDSVAHAVAFNNTDFYFAAKSGNSGYQLWKSGGTTATTSLVKVINPSGNAFDKPAFTGSMIKTSGCFLNNDFFFYANDGVNGFELWKSDGTTAGTVMVKNINQTGSSKANFLELCWNQNNQFIKVGSKLYFIANDGVHGYEVWVTDGTTAGTQMAADINPAGSAFDPAMYNPYPSTYSVIPFTLTDSISVFNAFNGFSRDMYYIDKNTSGLKLLDINNSYPDILGNPYLGYYINSFHPTTIPELGIMTAFSPDKGYELYKYSTTSPPNPNLTCAINSSCTGDSITIFHNFPAKPGIGNISTLQMSDSSGSFASPVNIATFTSTNATQNYAIPTGTIPGLHYRFRITTSVPPAILPDNGVDVVISAKPQITNCVDSIFVNAQPSQCGANVNYNFTAAGSPQGESDYSIASNSFFPVGTTPVYFIAWNGCGYDTCHFVVVVVDSVSPQIVCPADITTATSTVTYAASATDNCGIPTVTFNPPSGTSFPLGTTLVTATATDSSGNNSTCQFAVTITTLRVAGENNNALNNDQFTISPVPVNEQMVIDLDLSLKGSINISIKDITGFTRFSKDVMCIEGNNSLKINTHDLVNGVYAVELTGNNIHTVQKVVVKK